MLFTVLLEMNVYFWFYASIIEINPIAYKWNDAISLKEMKTKIDMCDWPLPYIILKTYEFSLLWSRKFMLFHYCYDSS